MRLTDDQVRFVRARQAYWTRKLIHAQHNCPHTNATKRPRAVTGYSEPTEYFYDCQCEICGKYWTEDQ